MADIIAADAPLHTLCVASSVLTYGRGFSFACHRAFFPREHVEPLVALLSMGTEGAIQRPFWVSKVVFLVRWVWCVFLMSRLLGK